MSTAPRAGDLPLALARLGFAAPNDAARHLEALALGGDGLVRLARACAAAPDPDLAVVQVCRWIAMSGQLPSAATLHRLAMVLGLSTSLGAFLARHPEHAAVVADSRVLARPRTLRGFTDQAMKVIGRADHPMAALRVWKRRELLRIACRDLAGAASVEEVGRELAWLAEAAVRAALSSLLTEHPAPPGARFAVIGMGKLGGEELNYASDIDVIFVCDGPEDPSVSAWATTVGEGLVQRLAATTEEGQAFRVDTTLRPEGRQGALVRSLAGYRAYYERWARPWEFQALIKARPIAGDPTLGQQFTDLARPSVYPEQLSADAIREIRGIKARIERERLGAREDPKTQLKVGAGGLIDVEFTTQLLQLAYGHRDPRLRVPGTIPAIAAATEVALVDLEKGRWLVDAYRFLNRVRNMLYLIRGRPTDALPTESEQLETLARALGYPSPGARNAFMEEYRRTTRRARQVCEDVFYGGRLARR